MLCLLFKEEKFITNWRYVPHMWTGEQLNFKIKNHQIFQRKIFWLSLVSIFSLMNRSIYSQNLTLLIVILI